MKKYLIFMLLTAIGIAIFGYLIHAYFSGEIYSISNRFPGPQRYFRDTNKLQFQITFNGYLIFGSLFLGLGTIGFKKAYSLNSIKKEKSKD
jgi:hypothetical protein